MIKRVPLLQMCYLLCKSCSRAYLISTRSYQNISALWLHCMSSFAFDPSRRLCLLSSSCYIRADLLRFVLLLIRSDVSNVRLLIVGSRGFEVCSDQQRFISTVQPRNTQTITFLVGVLKHGLEQQHAQR